MTTDSVEKTIEQSDASAYAVQVASGDHYLPAAYLTPRRMASIGYQVSLLNKHFGTGEVLEVGVGSGLAAHLLRRQGNNVSTLDFDARLNPDIVGSVTAIPVESDSFDSFVCCQVLEHMPWEQSRAAIGELARVSRKGGVISVPTNHPQCYITIFNRKHNGWRCLPVPFLRGKKVIRQKEEHFWELETGVSTSAFREALHECGFSIVRDFQPAEYPYHHFFVLARTGGKPASGI